MGHHIDKEGRFQSDRHPDLAPDKIVVSFKDPKAWLALNILAYNYQATDPDLAADMRERLRTIRSDQKAPENANE